MKFTGCTFSRRSNFGAAEHRAHFVLDPLASGGLQEGFLPVSFFEIRTWLLLLLMVIDGFDPVRVPVHLDKTNVPALKPPLE
jgi:hypothetical protein